MHANEEPREETSLPIKGRGSRAARRSLFQHLLAPRPDGARPALLAHRVHGPGLTPRLPRGPRLAAHGPPLTCPTAFASSYVPMTARPTEPAKPMVEPQTLRVEELNSQTQNSRLRQAGLLYLLSGIGAHDALAGEAPGPGPRPALDSPGLLAILLKALTTWAGEARPCTFLKMQESGQREGLAGIPRFQDIQTSCK